MQVLPQDSFEQVLYTNLQGINPGGGAKSRFLNLNKIQLRTKKQKLVMAELLARKYSQMEVAVAVTTLLITYI